MNSQQISGATAPNKNSHAVPGTRVVLSLAIAAMLSACSLAPGQHMIEPRYALYLDTGDGSTTTLLLDRQYNGPPVRYGTLDGKPIAVIGSLAPQLAQWAAQANLVHCTANTPGSGPANAHF